MGVRLGREAHGPSFVTEATLMPWIQIEAERFRVPVDALKLDAKNEAKRDRLRAAIARLSTAYVAGGIEEADYLRDLAAMKAGLEAIVDVPSLVDVPQSIDWTAWSPEHINQVLRTYWSAVELGDDLRPIRADWRLPEEYVA
jgi:hypothetical protein